MIRARIAIAVLLPLVLLAVGIRPCKAVECCPSECCPSQSSRHDLDDSHPPSTDAGGCGDGCFCPSKVFPLTPSPAVQTRAPRTVVEVLLPDPRLSRGHPARLFEPPRFS